MADTLRADALGCYGREGDPTPALDDLARQGVRFDRAFSQSYWTRPSMASLMTGRYVAATGVQASSQRLHEAYETLAERLADGGFTTVGVLTNTNAGPHAGLDQGFDRLRLMLSLKPEQHQRTDRLIAEVVSPVLDDLDDDDVFLYLHLMEPHGPYGPLEPPADFRLSVGGSPLPFDSNLDRPWSPQPTAAQRAALYDYDVRSMDRALGGFFARLDRRWSSPDGMPPILAFVSDHSAAEERHIAVFSLFGRRYGYAALIKAETPWITRFSKPPFRRRVTDHWPRQQLERELLLLRHSYLESQAGIRERLRRGRDESAQIIDRQALENLKALGYLHD